jgi:CRISPR/Cas system-associated protein Csm6
MRTQLLPQIIFLVMAAALSGALAFYAYRGRSRQGVILLVLSLIAMSEWSLAYALELAAQRPG